MVNLALNVRKDHGFFVFLEIGRGQPQDCMIEGIKMTNDQINRKVAELAGFKRRSEADPRASVDTPVFSEEEVWVSPEGKVYNSVPDFVSQNGRKECLALLKSKGMEVD